MIVSNEHPRSRWPLGYVLTACALLLGCTKHSGAESADLNKSDGDQNQEEAADVLEPGAEDPVAWLREQNPGFARPEPLDYEDPSVPTRPSDIAAVADKPQISTSPVLEPAPNLEFDLPMPISIRANLCERSRFVDGAYSSIYRLQPGPNGPIASWHDQDGDGRFEVIARHTYDDFGRVVSVVRENRESDNSCWWYVEHEELGYDDHGAVVRHSGTPSGDESPWLDVSARLYDADGRVRWIYKGFGADGIWSATRVSWEGDHVVLAERFGQKGRWESTLVARWWQDSHVRVDEFQTDGPGFRWDSAKVFVRRNGTFVNVLHLDVDIDHPRTFSEIRFEGDNEIHMIYDNSGVLKSRHTIKPDGSMTSEDLGDDGEWVLIRKTPSFESGVLRFGDDKSWVIYRNECPDLEPPKLPALPGPGKCPPRSLPTPTYGRSENDR
jgi:hypothetical protein